MKTWNSSNTSAGQALIIEEDSGRSVAVAYDPEDGPLLAAAPDLLEALELVAEDLMIAVERLNQAENRHNQDPNRDTAPYFSAAITTARAAVHKAKGGE